MSVPGRLRRACVTGEPVTGELISTRRAPNVDVNAQSSALLCGHLAGRTICAAAYAKSPTRLSCPFRRRHCHKASEPCVQGIARRAPGSADMRAALAALFWAQVGCESLVVQGSHSIFKNAKTFTLLNSIQYCVHFGLLRPAAGRGTIKEDRSQNEAPCQDLVPQKSRGGRRCEEQGGTRGTRAFTLP